MAITNEKLEVVRPFLKETPFPFPVLYDKGGAAAKTYDVSGIPVTCIVDREGTLITSLAGFEEETFQREIAARVAPLLNP